jgi:hypothetical protein
MAASLKYFQRSYGSSLGISAFDISENISVAAKAGFGFELLDFRKETRS